MDARFENNGRSSVLYITLSHHLTGRTVTEYIEADWSKAKADKVRDKFATAGFDLNPHDTATTLADLKRMIKTKPWNGILIGWCTRGHPEFTELFEKVVEVCLQEVTLNPEMRLMFNTGPDDLVQPVLRNLPIMA